MGMTSQQAERLGRLVVKARTQKGLSLRDLEERTGLPRSWLGYLEQGRSLSVAPERLARLAEVLEIDPAQIDRVTRGAVSEGLPDARTYFRAKYKLAPEDIDKLARYVERLRRAA